MWECKASGTSSQSQWVKYYIFCYLREISRKVFIENLIDRSDEREVVNIWQSPVEKKEKTSESTTSGKEQYSNDME